MKTITLQNGKEARFEVDYATTKFSGYGHYKCTVDLMKYEGSEVKSFTYTTTDMEFIDSLKNDDLSSEDKYEAIYSHMEDEIEEQVAEWIYFLQD